MFFVCVNVQRVRVLIDYRPALRERSGVGEYVYQLARALLAAFSPGATGPPLDLTLFSSSWKDRLTREAGIDGATIVDRRIPVRLMNLAWHRLGWPPIEGLTNARFDVTHSPHPLLVASRTSARVVTIHDLDFLTHPERARAEIRRDYPALARRHAHRADRIIVPSQSTAREVERRLEVPPDRISVCPHGRPAWPPRTAPPADGGYVLFLGTLEPRKNVGGLLDAWERLAARHGPASGARRDPRSGPAGIGTGAQRRKLPELILAGKATEAAQPWLDRIARPPLLGLVRHIGYVDPARRRELFVGARLLVQPSFEEGFGLPVLEAMTVGVPVVAASRGALPEVLGDAGMLVDPGDPDEMAAAIARLIEDDGLAATSASKGLVRSCGFDWERTAHGVYTAYQLAMQHRQCASA
jgi:glycosyltransferase involved in cell wall biosynthesis